ncbi:MAG: hypothetical protein CTY15_01660 [Methylocystis sp.]|nr:MAG: hypothetical protein CTY15_01660 [Methylocystis sp.]
MKKLLIIPAFLALSSSAAFAQSPIGINNSFGGGFTANATVLQSIGNLGYATTAQQYATVLQNSPNLAGAPRIRGSFVGGFNATANVNQSVSGLYNGAQTLQNAAVVQNSPAFTNTSP